MASQTFNLGSTDPPRKPEQMKEGRYGFVRTERHLMLRFSFSGERA
jgi:hypothetical protein